jgi:hypothetical protein
LINIVSGHQLTMRPRLGKLPVVLAALGLLWAELAYSVRLPSDFNDYRRTVVQVAEAAYNATRTGWLTGRQKLAGQVFDTFAVAAFDDASKALAGASKQFAEQGPPDERSARLRDELNPLVQDAVRWLGSAAQAEDDEALRAAVDALGSLADRLRAFVEANQ